MRFSSSDRFHSASDALRALANKDFIGDSKRETAPNPTPSQPARSPSSTRVEAQIRENTPIPGRGSTAAEAVVAAAQVASASESVTETAKGDLQRPANSDVPSSRSDQPTEKIDLERVKAIIARDTQRKANTTSPNYAAPEGRERSNSASVQPVVTSRSAGPKTHTAPSTKGVGRASLINYFYSLPTVAKSATVALLSAVVTVGALLAWHSLSGASAPNSASQEIPPQEQDSTVAQDGTLSSNDQRPEVELGTVGLHSLPEGLYTGTMRGLLPAGDIPLAFISRPDVGGVVLALGIEGWTPVTASTSEKESSLESTTFRSNGLILQFNRELSSDKITGTVIDVVTGESGVWSVEKTS
jgi:hypothetical protein